MLLIYLGIKFVLKMYYQLTLAKLLPNRHNTHGCQFNLVFNKTFQFNFSTYNGLTHNVAVQCSANAHY